MDRRKIPDEDIQITVGGQRQRGLRFGEGRGTPVYVGARAVVSRVPGGVKIWLSDYKGSTEEIIAESISDIITNEDGSLTFVLPDGRTIVTESLSVKDYEILENQPLINNVTVIGSKSGEDYNLQDKMKRITEQEIDNIIYGG